MARNNLWRTLVVASAVAFLTGLVPGCGSDDDNDGMETVPCVALDQSPTPVANSVVAQDGSSGNCNVLRVNLIVTGPISDLFGANLIVTFPESLVSFSSASEVGSILTSGSAVDVQAAVSNPGELTVGITRLGSTGVDVTGGPLLLRLDFVRIATQGSGALNVSGALLDSSTPPQVIPGTMFPGGARVVVFQT